MKFLFESHMNDGSVINQSHDDVSFDGTGSAFTDVRKRMDQVELFGIYNEDLSEVWTVNLVDGSFSHNDSVFTLPCTEVTSDTPLRLIYYRRNTVVIASGQEQSHDVEFVIGWQATVNGVNHQRTIAVT